MCEVSGLSEGNGRFARLGISRFELPCLFLSRREGLEDSTILALQQPCNTLEIVGREWSSDLRAAPNMRVFRTGNRPINICEFLGLFGGYHSFVGRRSGWSCPVPDRGGSASGGKRNQVSVR